MEWNFDVDPKEIFEFFLTPPIEKNYTIKWREPEREKIIELMVEEHDFSRERIENALNKLFGIRKEGTQLRLEGWFKK